MFRKKQKKSVKKDSYKVRFPLTVDSIPHRINSETDHDEHRKDLLHASCAVLDDVRNAKERVEKHKQGRPETAASVHRVKVGVQLKA